jgi:hypothetical protein
VKTTYHNFYKNQELFEEMLTVLNKMDERSISFHAIHQVISFRPNNSGIVAFQSQSKGRARTNEIRNNTHNPVMKYAIADEILSMSIVRKLKINYGELSRKIFTNQTLTACHSPNRRFLCECQEKSLLQDMVQAASVFYSQQFSSLSFLQMAVPPTRRPV